MRDLSTQELGFVYGAGGKSKCKPPKKSKCKGSGSRGSRGKCSGSRKHGSRSRSRGRCS